MKLHACRHCGSRLRNYTELQEHLKTHPNVCVTCYRVFSKRSNLLAHKSTVEEYLCEVCQRSYNTQTKLAREYGSELQDVIIQHWGSIRTHTSHGQVQSRYNIGLTTSDIGGLELGHILAAQTTAFKINISYGVSFFEIGHQVDTDITIALVTAVVDTSTNLA